MKMSRNDPCPCGSGKKIKKCCESKGTAPAGPPPLKKDHYLSGDVPHSPDIPLLSEDFFTKVNTGFSAYGLINSCILRPEVESIAAQFSNKQINRGKAEADEIRNCHNVYELVMMLRDGIDNLNHVLLQNLLLEKPDESVAALMLELKNTVSDIFVEVSVKTIALTKINVSVDLMRLIEKHDKSVYQISLLCLLLGYQKHVSILQFLWDHYRFFKSSYPKQNYWQGPFFGLWEQWAGAGCDDVNK